MKSEFGSVQLKLVGIVGLLALGTLLVLGQQGGSNALLGAASGTAVTTGRPLRVAITKSMNPKERRVLQIETEALTGLIDALEARGAHIDVQEYEQAGLSLWHVTVDGKQISPVVANCKECEPIVYEY